MAKVMRFLMFLAILYLPNAVYANTWQICDLMIKALSQKNGYIQAQVVQVKAKPQVECPLVGEFIDFQPNTKNWQGVLPKRQWPKNGQIWNIRYQYLDGICKNDGNDKPCRIKNYPKLT